MTSRPGHAVPAAVRRTLRWGSALLAALGCCLLGLLVTAAPAAAHNVLESTAPADRASVSRVPAEVVLTFNEPALAMGTQVLVRGPRGEVAAGPPRLVDNTVRQTIGAGAPAGDYTVEWRVTSADGHPVSGQFGFTASSTGGSSTSAVPSPAPATAPGSGSSSGSTLSVVLVAAGVLLVLGIPTAVLRRRRRRGIRS